MPGGVPLSLHIHAIEAKPVLIDDAINAAVTGASKLRRRVSNGAPVTHRDEKFDDHLLEEAGAVLQNALEKLFPQCRVECQVDRLDLLLRGFEIR